MNLLSSLFRKNSARRLGLVYLIPFVLFGVDFAFSPIFIDTQVGQEVSIAGVFRNGSVSIGTLRGHHLFVSVDDIRDHAFLSNMPKGKTALVVTMFPKDSKDYTFGPLSLAVLSRLQSLSGDDYLRFRTIPDQLRGNGNGQVNNLDLHIPSDKYHLFPVTSLLIVSMEQSQDEQSLEAIFKRAFAVADEQSVDNVLVPNLGLKWQNSERAADVPLSDYFKSFFNGVQKSQRPNNIYVSLYKAWPTLQLEDVVSALDSEWDVATSETITPLPLHNKNTRLLTAFLLLCLISSGVATKLTMPRVLIIVVAFYSVGFAAIELVEKIADGQNEEAKLYSTLIVLAILSLSFPFFARVEVKDIFRRGGLD